MMEQYIKAHHQENVREILEAETIEDIRYFALQIDLTVLKTQNETLFDKLNYRDKIWEERPKWISALNNVQQETLKSTYGSVKLNFPVAFFNIPNFTNKNFRFECLYHLVELEVRVIRIRDVSQQEILREFKCRTCKKAVILEVERHHQFFFDEPKSCIATKECKGSMFNTEDAEKGENEKFYMPFQEIKVAIKDRNSRSPWTVELDNELVGKCSIGEMVKVCGTFELRYERGTTQGQKAVIRAVNIQPMNRKMKSKSDPCELEYLVRSNWSDDLIKYENELTVRDRMVESVAPELEGLATVKLGLLLVLCSGGAYERTEEKAASTKTREICHLLLAGDPGTGKSQILKAAAKISDNSVTTVGYSTTTAGLTAHCYKENGYNAVEGGALVRANGGVCCIDEINLMTKEHRSSIHEVMESQKISFAKDGIMMDLPTRVSIIGAMNTRNPSKPIEGENFALEGSLLSRFDLIFAFQNPCDDELEDEIIDHILNGTTAEYSSSWSLERIKQHIVIAKEIKVEMTAEALEIIENYFRFCQYQEDIEKSRTSLRLMNSLTRLTICHAKLLLRSKVEIVDALAAIMVTESSWSFGYLIKQSPIITSTFPLGPSREMVVSVLDRFDLQHLLDQHVRKPNSQLSKNFEKHKIENVFEDLSDEEELEIKPKVETIGSSSSDIKNEPSTSIRFEAKPNPLIEILKAKSQQSEPKKIVDDPLKYNLMQLAASLVKSNVSEFTGIPTQPKAEPTEAKPSNPTMTSNIQEKLKSFQYEKDSTTQPKKENEPAYQSNVDLKKKFMETEFNCLDDDF